MKTIIKRLPTGITTTQKKVGKKILITVDKNNTKIVTYGQKLVVSFMFGLVLLGTSGLMIQLFAQLSLTGKLFFSPLFLANFYLLALCMNSTYKILKR